MPELYPQNEINMPAKCGQDRLTLLVKDPHWLYVYWEISETRKNLMLQDFGMDLLERSIPVLKVINISKNECFYVRINEFSNSWYLNVPDSNCLYMVEIGRRISENFFISILNSNSIVTPGESLSYDTSACFVNYIDLREGRLDIGNMKKYEFLKPANEERHFGESSAQFYTDHMKG